MTGPQARGDSRAAAAPPPPKANGRGASGRTSGGRRLAPEEIRVEFIRASGPGGQNVNKVSTAVRLTVDVRASTSLPADVKERLARLAGRRMTENGVLIIEARRYRSQEQNRADALRRLHDLIELAQVRPPLRRRTQPTAAARAKRLDAKRIRSIAKRRRARVRDVD